jgi:hypothetical protein
MQLATGGSSVGRLVAGIDIYHLIRRSTSDKVILILRGVIVPMADNSIGYAGLLTIHTRRY